MQNDIEIWIDHSFLWCFSTQMHYNGGLMQLFTKAFNDLTQQISHTPILYCANPFGCDFNNDLRLQKFIQES